MAPDVDEQTHLDDITSMTDRGNHKSATKEPNATTLLKKFDKEVHHSFMIPVIASAMIKIENLSINPNGSCRSMDNIRTWQTNP